MPSNQNTIWFRWSSPRRSNRGTILRRAQISLFGDALTRRTAVQKPATEDCNSSVDRDRMGEDGSWEEETERRIGERGEGEGQFKAVTHGFLIGWLADIIQQIGWGSEVSIACCVFGFHFSFSIYLFVVIFCNQIGLIRYTSCLFRGTVEVWFILACMTLCA